MALDKTQTLVHDTILSIVGRMNGFLYRCRNDKSYSMIFMAGDVPLLTGRAAGEFTKPGGLSYAGHTHPEDLDAVYAAVDTALARRENWSVDYRIRRADGSDRWVHEIGGGVWQVDQLLFLEGVVIDKDQGKRAELTNSRTLAALTEQSRLLMDDTAPIVEILRTLRILAINARLEAGRAGPMGAAFGFVAQEVSRLAEQTSILAEHMAEVTEGLRNLLVTDSRV
jgi:PAS domain-containing protein